MTREKETAIKWQFGSSIHLDTQTGLAPVPPLRVVAVGDVSHRCHRVPSPPVFVVIARRSGEKGGGCIVPDGVVGSETDPLRDRAVLLLGLGQLDLGPETLVALFVVGKNRES